MSTSASTQNLAASLKRSDLLNSKGYINGEWVDATDGETFPIINPATGETLVTCPNMPQSQIKGAIKAAKTAMPAWATLTAYQRSAYLTKLFQAMETNVEDLAKILTAENGKPLAEAKGEMAYGASFVSWFAAEALRTYGHTVPSPFPGTRNTIIRQPIGVAGLITPWNFPNAMITRKMAPALAAGCTVVIKAPAETPLSALAMAVLCEEVGIPKGVVNVVTVQKGEREAACGIEMCENPMVSKISFTGSTPVGRLLMKQSSSTIKKLSFELGGNAAFIIFNDADLDLAVQGVVASKFRNSGQTCVSANRIYVQSGVYDKFSQLLTDKVNTFKVGNGLNEGINVGPLVNITGVQKVERHVKDALEQGAKVLTGGKAMDNSKGTSFFEPTVLVDVPATCAIADEETFGPLAALFKFETDDEVIKRANDSDVGLAAYFYTKDLNRSTKVSEALEVGMVAVNTGVLSQSCVPFGGVKQSGFGREGGKSGIDEYMVDKLIVTGGL